MQVSSAQSERRSLDKTMALMMEVYNEKSMTIVRIHHTNEMSGIKVIPITGGNGDTFSIHNQKRIRYAEATCC